MMMTVALARKQGLIMKYGCLEKLEFLSEDKERKNQKAQHT